MTTLIFFTGVYLFAVSPIAIMIYLWRQPREYQVPRTFFLIASLALAYGFGVIAGSLYYNPLPFVAEHFTPIIPHAPDNGFPSHHVLLTAALAAIATVWNRKMGVALWAVVLLVGAARIYGGVHHLVDVGASIALAIVATAISFLILKSLGMWRE